MKFGENYRFETNRFNHKKHNNKSPQSSFNQSMIYGSSTVNSFSDRAKSSRLAASIQSIASSRKQDHKALFNFNDLNSTRNNLNITNNSPRFSNFTKLLSPNKNQTNSLLYINHNTKPTPQAKNDNSLTNIYKVDFTLKSSLNKSFENKFRSIYNKVLDNVDCAYYTGNSNYTNDKQLIAISPDIFLKEKQLKFTKSQESLQKKSRVCAKVNNLIYKSKKYSSNIIFTATFSKAVKEASTPQIIIKQDKIIIFLL